MMPLNYCGLMKSSFYVLNRVFGDLFALQMFYIYIYIYIYINYNRGM